MPVVLFISQEQQSQHAEVEIWRFLPLSRRSVICNIPYILNYSDSKPITLIARIDSPAKGELRRATICG
jgi:hypothetical protein